MNKTRNFIVAATLLVLSSTAFAQVDLNNPHRSHVAQRLEAASAQLLSAEQQVSTFLRYYAAEHVSSTGAIAESNVRGNGDYVLLYIAKAQNTIAEVLSVIHTAPNVAVTGEVDIWDLRRALNQPFEGATCTTEDMCSLGALHESLAYEMSVAQRYIARLTGAHIQDPNHGTYNSGANLRSAGKFMAFAWAEAEFAIWHMNDTIYYAIGAIN